jgi:hypothetical protein
MCIGVSLILERRHIELVTTAKSPGPAVECFPPAWSEAASRIQAPPSDTLEGLREPLPRVAFRWHPKESACNGCKQNAKC